MQKQRTKNSWKNQFQEIPHQSGFHERARLIFVEDSFWKRFKCYQEVAVSDLVETYPHKNHHIDWYIETFNIVLELHGEQHYRPIAFSSMFSDQKTKNFHDLQYRDNLKKTALKEAGYDFFEIPYKDRNNLSGQWFKNLFFGD